MSANHKYARDLLNDDLNYVRCFHAYESLEEKLQELKKAPSVEQQELTKLKKLKLYLHDRMHKLEHENLCV